jgi:hypothetical protein
MDKKDIYTRSILKASGKPFDESVVKEKKILWWYNIRLKKRRWSEIDRRRYKIYRRRSQIKNL